MIPAAFVPLDAFPLTPAGKVDRSTLPPPGAARQASAAYVPPQTATEATLAQMAAGLLKLDRIGIHDNFFDLGGHSLLATQLISRIREDMGVDLPLRTLFEHPTVAGLATAVDEAIVSQQGEGAGAQAPAPAITPRPRGGRRMTLAELEAEERAGQEEQGAGGGAA
jgi:acyl carrier protein